MGATQSCGFGVLNKSTIPEINIGLSMQATHYYENGVKENEIFYRWPGAVWYTVYAYARDPSGKNDITNGQVVKEVVLSTVLGGIGTIGVAIAAGIPVVVATMGAAHSPAAFAGLAAEAGGITAAGGAGLIAEAVASGATALPAEASELAGAVASGTGALSSTFGAYKSTEAASLALENSKLYCEWKGNYGGGSGSWLVVEGGPYMDEHGKFQPRDLSIRKATQEEIENGVFTEISHERFHTCEGLQCTRRCPYCKK